MVQSGQDSAADDSSAGRRGVGERRLQGQAPVRWVFFWVVFLIVVSVGLGGILLGRQ